MKNVTTIFNIRSIRFMVLGKKIKDNPDETSTLNRTYVMWKEVTAISLTILLMVVVSIVTTNVAIKLARFVIDTNTYGKYFSSITIEDKTGLLKTDDVNERIDEYREIMNKTKRYATWPNLKNFDESWFRNSDYETRLPQKSLWYVKDCATNSKRKKRRALMFLHGGATFAGSPHKYNNVHWLKTIGWLGDDRYTDVISIDYRLRPEFTIDDSINDCLRSVLVVFRTLTSARNELDSFHLLGFSAGGMLSLQVAMIIEKSMRYFDENVTPSTTTVFNVNVAADPITRELCQPKTGLWRNHARKQLYLIAPLCRLDRLFVNLAYDVSNILGIFSDAFFEQQTATYDPLFNLTLHGLTLREFQRIKIIDVCRNSLSNHAISLYECLRAFRRNATKIRVFDERDMHVKPDVLRKIREFDLKTGRPSNKFVNNELQKLEKNNNNNNRLTKITSFLVYHFFMYIVPCNASWETLKLILTD